LCRTTDPKTKTSVLRVCCFTDFGFRQVQLLYEVRDRFGDALRVIIFRANAALLKVMACDNN
jgi:hypothetical protein